MIYLNTLNVAFTFDVFAWASCTCTRYTSLPLRLREKGFVVNKKITYRVLQ